MGGAEDKEEDEDEEKDEEEEDDNELVMDGVSRKNSSTESLLCHSDCLNHQFIRRMMQRC